jgi:hypothetical protein
MKRPTSMCVMVGLMTALVAGAGCRKSDDDAFRGGVPTREAVVLHLPGAPDDGGGATTATGGSTAAVHSTLLGQTADTYNVTRAATELVNGGTWAVLTLVRTIVSYPATSHGVDSAVWGPWTDTDPLSGNTWRLTVTRVASHEFQWLFEARGKHEDDAAFRTIISGDHTAAVDAQGDPIEGFGNGTFLIDWDEAAMLPTHDTNVGKASFTYARLTPTASVTVNVSFTGIKDSAGEIFNAVYQYAQTPGQGGQLAYAEDKDNYPGPGPTGTAKEHFTILSRWTEDGTGRCDLEDQGGDLMTTVAHGSECWNDTFASVYRYLEYPDAQGNWGAESACTAFPTASYANL